MTDGSVGEHRPAVEAGGARRSERYGALSDQYRRFVLQYLRSAGTPLGLDELVDELAAREARRPVSERSCDDRADLEIALVHCHLPKLAEAGLLEYDRASGTVAPGDRIDEDPAVLGDGSSE